MGRFHKEVILKGPKGERKVDLLVDTGAVTSMINKIPSVTGQLYVDEEKYKEWKK